MQSQRGDSIKCVQSQISRIETDKVVIHRYCQVGADFKPSQCNASRLDKKAVHGYKIYVNKKCILLILLINRFNSYHFQSYVLVHNNVD